MLLRTTEGSQFFRQHLNFLNYYSTINFIRKFLTSSIVGSISQRKSTVTNLVEFTSSTTKNIEQGFQTDALYTDFSKAFDRVCHSILLFKLDKLGFCNSLIAWLSSYLSERSQMVKVGSCYSTLFWVPSGVPQGSHLGPILFNLFINDILNCLSYSNALLFADDLKICRLVNDFSDAAKLQSDLDALCAWCDVNQLHLNFDKCKIISFTRKKSPIIFYYKIGNIPLHRVSEVIDLGVTLDAELNFRSHISVIISKANRMLGFVKRTCSEFDDPFVLKTLFCSFVRSGLEYANCVWTPHYSIHISRIERVQQNFSRFALRKLGWRDALPCYEERLKLLGLKTLKDRRIINSALFVGNLLNSNIIAPEILSLLKIKVNPYNFRHRDFLEMESHRTNYGLTEPINNMCCLFNDFFKFYDFDLSKNDFKKKIYFNM